MTKRIMTEAEYAARQAKGKVRVTQFTNGYPPMDLQKAAAIGIPVRPSKFRNVKTEVDGIKFDSKKEAKRWQELKLMEAAKDIFHLKRQVKYLLLASQVRADGTKERPVVYVADFEYESGENVVVEDVKGRKTPDYILKRKMMLHFHGVTIKET